jgi:hypothetical protein
MNMPDTHPDDLSRTETLTIVKKIIERSAKPLNADEIHKDIPELYQLNKQSLTKLLQQETAAGAFHRWSAKNRSRQDRFWHQDESLYFRNKILSVVSRQELTLKDLLKKMNKDAFSFSQNRLSVVVNTTLATLIKEKMLFEIPSNVKNRKSRYASHPPDLAVYLNKVQKEFDSTCKKLKKFGIGTEQLFMAFENTLSLSLPARSLSEATVREPEPHIAPETEISEAVLNRIIQTILKIEPGAAKQAPVWIPDLRQAVDLSKNMFDRAVLMLSEQGKVFLNRHAHPAQMDDAKKETMIPDGHGNYFVVIGLREGFRG